MVVIGGKALNYMWYYPNSTYTENRVYQVLTYKVLSFYSDVYCTSTFIFNIYLFAVSGDFGGVDTSSERQAQIVKQRLKSQAVSSYILYVSITVQCIIRIFVSMFHSLYTI